MKNTIYLLLIVFFSNTSFSQEKLLKILPIENGNVVYTEVIKVENVDKKELYNRAKKWIVLKYKSANDVIQLDSKEDGTTELKRKTNLQGKINGLHESGKLTSQNAEILHEHRFLGNETVHELSSPSKEDLALAIEIVENVFDTLYEIPNKGLQLKRKRLGQ
jgi:hypothetical protein